MPVEFGAGVMDIGKRKYGARQITRGGRAMAHMLPSEVETGADILVVESFSVTFRHELLPVDNNLQRERHKM